VKLSIIVPTIRPQNLRELWASAEKAINGRYPWEMVAIGPNNATRFHARFEDPNYGAPWRFLQDEGSPCHCQQRALLHCKGDYVTWAADDGIFLPNSLDLCWDGDCILCKYIEGRPDELDLRWSMMDQGLKRIVFMNARGDMGLNPDMVANDRFWTIGYHQVDRDAVKTMPPESWCLCLGIIKRDVLLSVGGWDENFETTGRATVDLGLRLQKAGVKFVIWQHIVQALSYDPKGAEASAMHAAYEDDLKRYRSLWAYDAVEAVVPIHAGADKPGDPWARRAAK
jgi:hypothetical protein